MRWRAPAFRPPAHRPLVRLSALCTGLLIAAGAPPAAAVMVGAPPDTPQAHVEPNRNDSAFSAVVSVRVNGSPFSGVVVAPLHVLTAAHVVGTQPPSALAVQVNLDAQAVQRGVTAVQRFASASFPYDDLALLTLDAPLPPDLRIPPILRSRIDTGTVITLVGHGASGAGTVGPNVAASATVRRRGRNVIDAVQPTIDTSGRRSLFYLFDFDGPDGNGALGGPSLGNAEEAGLAGGDSGSPVFATVGGTLWLVGINNLVAPAPGETTITYRFGSVCGGMLLSDARFLAWLEEQTHGSLGQQPGREGEAPLPAWGLGLLGLLLAGRARRIHRPRR